MWTKKERFEAVLNHELADRPPVSAWRHFTENEHSGADLFVETMLKWQNTYDWDYVKLQPRASYYEEAWGGQFDYNDYEGILPKVVKDPLAVWRIWKRSRCCRAVRVCLQSRSRSFRR